ncbi:MAG: phosphoenolpyruvate carboxykinase (ATP) [Oscillospiraceae bacterium]|jgi:phosphoenolpyruvate carboxykinase (ATP)|nr:phosphoenolpyruvate carboxykinase (ATP) [Oscillospiraceae bacterium]
MASALNLEALGIIHPTEVYHNLSPAALTERAVARGEGMLSETGALCVYTGKYTGRSPDDRFIADEPSVRDLIDWGKVNVPISSDKFNNLYSKITAYLQNREIFVFDGYAGADPDYRVNIRVINELASENLFIHQLLLRPEESELESFEPGFTIIAAPGLKAVPETDGVHSEAAVVLSFERKLVLVIGTQYAGEIKKSVFSLMNFLMPQRGVFTMHCSANVGEGGDSALFFGLSGTGKTTLSADPERYLIGDDEHGWSPKGIFNIEGGCYAKCINLSKENEPQIWDAIKFGALVENVVIDPKTRKLDYADESITENTRVGYPVDYIPNAKIPGVSGHPKTVIFLTADAFGVMPPISKLSREAAMYHFVTGYTAKLAGTERGVTTPQATFSTCFGAPFLPLPASLYAKMLGECIDAHGSNVYLVNTGWSGGPAGKGGSRMKIKYTRAMVSAALDGSLEKEEFELDPVFNVLVPKKCPNVPDEVLAPRNTWADKSEYDAAAKNLAQLFRKNFEKYKGMDEKIIEAGPKG